MNPFASLGLGSEIVSALTEQGYEYFIYSYQDFREKYGTYVEIMKKMKELRAMRDVMLQDKGKGCRY